MAYVKVSSTRNVTAALRYGEHEKDAVKGSVDCANDTETARKMFRADRIMWGKDDDGAVQGHVIIQSFDDADGLTPAQANKLGAELAAKVAPGYRAMVYTHTHNKGEHTHNHIVIESVRPEDGRKLDAHGFLDRARAASDEICREHGLHVIDGSHPRAVKYSRAEGGMMQRGKAGESWKIAMRSAIFDAEARATSLDDFEQKLKRRGITINERTRKRDGLKSWTYYDEAGHRCRAAKLGADFTREHVVEAVEARSKAAEVQAATTEERPKTSTERGKAADQAEKRLPESPVRPSEAAAGITVPPEKPPIPAGEDIRNDVQPMPPPPAPPAPKVAEDFGEYEALRVEDANSISEVEFFELDRIFTEELPDIDHAAIFDLRLGRDRLGELHVLPAPFADKKRGEVITLGEIEGAAYATRADAEACGDVTEREALKDNAETIDDLCDKADAAIGKVQSALGDVQKAFDILDPKVKGTKKLKTGLKDLASGLIKTPIKMIRNILTNPVKGILLAPFAMFESAKDVAFGAMEVGAGAEQIATGDREARRAEEQKQRVRQKHTDSDGDEEDQEQGQEQGRGGR